MRARAVRLASFVVVFVLALGLAPAAFAVDTTHIVRLPIDGCLRENLSASGPVIAWLREPGGDNGGAQVAYYDMRTGKETVIAGNASVPRASEDFIVYIRQLKPDYTDPALFVWDIRTGTETMIARSRGLGPQSEPGIDGGVVVWVDLGAPMTIHGKDLITGREFVVASMPFGEGSVASPSISNGWVAYVQGRSLATATHGIVEEENIYAYEVATGRIVALCEDSHRQYCPSIGPTGFVTWQDFRADPTFAQCYNCDIYGRSVYGGREVRVAGGKGMQTQPQSGGSYVVYADDFAPKGYRFVAKDLLAGTTFGLVPASLAGSERLYVSPLGDGTIAWTNTHFHRDSGTYTTQVYVSRPTEIDLLGETDYESVAAVSREAFPSGCATAVVACASDWADTLAATGMGEDVPVLLTAKGGLPSATASELARLGATNVVILGGTGAVSDTVQQQIDAIVQANVFKAGVSPMFTALRDRVSASGLIAATPRVTRLGGGKRYGSSLAVADRMMTSARWDGTVVVANGDAYADAMSAASLTSRGAPLILASRNGLSKGAIALLKARGARRAVVVGSRKTLPAMLVGQLRKVVGRRGVVTISGADSAATSVAAATYGVRHLGMSYNGVGLATGNAASDTLGALVKSKRHTVVLVTDGKALSKPTASKLRKVRAGVSRATYVGPRRIGKKVRAEVRATLH